MRLISFCLWLAILFCNTAHAVSNVEYTDIQLSDGVTIQACARFPDPALFVGPRPAIMINMGSGLYDYCRDRTIKSDYVDLALSKGVAVFINLKRGIRHQPLDNTYTSDLSLFSQATLPQLRADALEAFEFFQRDPRIDPKKMAVWGGSEGTILSVYIASRHPELLEVQLSSTMIEDFPTLYARQMYEILPRDLMSTLDKDGDHRLSQAEVSPDFFSASGLESFQSIDIDHDGFLTQPELRSEIQATLTKALKTGDNTFLLSDMGGRITVNWVKSALAEKPLGPDVLALKMPVFLYHGTADESTLVQPVYDLESEAKALGKSNFRFTYFPGLGHELTREVIVDSISRTADDIARP